MKKKRGDREGERRRKGGWGGVGEGRDKERPGGLLVSLTLSLNHVSVL